MTRKPTVVKPMTPGIPRNARIRAYIAGVVVSLGLVGFTWRAWGLQVDDGGRYRSIAEHRHALSVELAAPRGEILDAHDRPLAVSADADSIWANPREIRDVAATADRLAAILGGDAATFEAKLASERRFVWIDRHVTPEIAHAIREAKLAGVELAREPRRWYPGGTIGGPIVGRADIDGNGVDGIELALNSSLTGLRGAARGLRDASGRRMFADGLEQPEPGATVKLTIDRSVQAIADAAIADAVEANKAHSGVVVVLDVATSRVLAMASYPTYDPNGWQPHESRESHDGARNRGVTDVFEAGSVMKMFTVVVALDEEVVAPDTEFDVQWGQLQIGPKLINDVEHDRYLTTTGIIKRSSNVGAVKIAQKLGRERLYNGLRRFGFGSKTGIELPGEQVGTLRPGAKWRDIELATIAYGYGLTVTPVQVAAALAAIGNDGVYQTPRVVESVTAADGTALYHGQTRSLRVVSSKSAAQMRAMLAAVFDKGPMHGTAHNLDVPGFTCGGKTGTAHKYDPATKKYAEDRYLSSFAGLAPIDHPQLAIAVFVDEPSGGDYFGGKVAGPVFARVASESLRYLGVPNGRASVTAANAIPANGQAPKPNAANGAAANGVAVNNVAANGVVANGVAANNLAANGAANGPAANGAAANVAAVNGAANGAAANAAVNGVVANNGAAINASSAGGDAAASLVAAFGLELPAPPPLAPGYTTVPDFRGLGVGRSIAAARDAHVELAVTGSGRAIAQEPAPGPARMPVRVRVRFSDGESRNLGGVSAEP